MRHSPEQLAAPAHQVAAHVMQPRTLADTGRLIGRPAQAREHGGAHLDVIEQGPLARLEARPIQSIETLRPLRQPRARSEQQQETQNHRYVDGHGSQRMTPERRALGW